MTLPAAEAPSDEMRLILRAKDGDVAALEELGGTCRKLAYVLALQLTGNREDAADLAQDSMLRFFRSLRRFDARRPVRPWLYRIVRNLYRDRLRRGRVRRTSSLDEITEAQGNDPPATGLGPEAVTSRRQLQEVVWRAVQRLPVHYREVLILRDYDGLAYAEIARVLRLPRGTIMSRLHRGRRIVREAVRACMGIGATEKEAADD